MEGNDFQMFSLVADQSHITIYMLMVLAEPYLTAIFNSSSIMLYVSSLLAIGVAMIKAPLDKSKMLLSTGILIVLVNIGMLSVTVSKSVLPGSEGSGEGTMEMPAATYYPWRMFALVSELFTSGVKLTRDHLDSQPMAGIALQTAIIAKKNASLYAEEFPDLIGSYHEYTSKCTSLLSDNKSLFLPDREHTYTNDDAYAVGLMGGGGIFLNGDTAVVSAGWMSNISNLWGGQKDKSNAIHGLTLLTYQDKVTKGEELLLTISKLQSSPLFLSDKGYTISIPDKSSPDGRSYTTPDSDRLNTAVYIGSHREASDRASWRNLEKDITESEINIKVSEAAKEHKIKYFPDTCQEMYYVVKRSIKEYQSYLSKTHVLDAESYAGTSVLSDRTQIGILASNQLVTQMNAMVVEKGKADASAGVYLANEDSYDNGIEKVKDLAAGTVQTIQEFKKVWDGFNLQFKLPMLITLLSALVALCFILTPLIFALSPLIGGEVIKTLYKIIGVLYLALFIFQLVFIMGSYLMDQIYQMALASLVGPGSKPLAIMMLQHSIGFAMLAACGVSVVYLAYMIINSDASGIKHANPQIGDANSAAQAIGGAMIIKSQLTPKSVKQPPNIREGKGGLDPIQPKVTIRPDTSRLGLASDGGSNGRHGGGNNGTIPLLPSPSTGYGRRDPRNEKPIN